MRRLIPPVMAFLNLGAAVYMANGATKAAVDLSAFYVIGSVICLYNFVGWTSQAMDDCRRTT